MNLDTLKVGDEVSIARHSNYGVRGVHTGKITKRDKVKIIVTTLSGNEYIFSAKRGQQKDFDGKYSSRSLFLEDMETRNKRDAFENREKEIRAVWSALELATRNKDIEAIKEQLNLLTELNK